MNFQKVVIGRMKEENVYGKEYRGSQCRTPQRMEHGHIDRRGSQILNGSWIRNLLKGRYHPVRMMQAGLVLLILCAMIGLMISGIILSCHALSFLPIKGGRSFARNLHMISAYWGFVLVSIHLGFHWNMIMGMAKKLFPRSSAVRKWTGRILAFMIAGYGIYAFIKRYIGVYMLLRSHFVFFDYEEPLVFFYLDYIAVMGLFVLIGNYICAGLRRSMSSADKK